MSIPKLARTPRREIVFQMPGRKLSPAVAGVVDQFTREQAAPGTLPVIVARTRCSECGTYYGFYCDSGYHKPGRSHPSHPSYMSQPQRDRIVDIMLETLGAR